MLKKVRAQKASFVCVIQGATVLSLVWPRAARTIMSNKAPTSLGVRTTNDDVCSDQDFSKRATRENRRSLLTARTRANHSHESKL